MGYIARTIQAYDVSTAVVLELWDEIETPSLLAGVEYVLFEGDIDVTGFTTTIISGRMATIGANNRDQQLRIDVDGTAYANINTTSKTYNTTISTDSDTTLGDIGVKTVQLIAKNTDGSDSDGIKLKHIVVILR